MNSCKGPKRHRLHTTKKRCNNHFEYTFYLQTHGPVYIMCELMKVKSKGKGKGKEIEA